MIVRNVRDPRSWPRRPHTQNSQGGTGVSIKSNALAGVLLVLAVVAALLAAGSASSRTDARAKKPNPNSIDALVAKFNAAYPWIKVTAYDLEDNTIFSKYASEASQGVRTADVLIASAPNLWAYAKTQGYAMDFTPQGLSAFPEFVKQFKGIYVMSPDPAIIV